MELEIFKAAVRLFIALPIILLLIYLIIKYGLANKRLGFVSHKKNAVIEVIEQVPLGMRNVLCLVKVADKFYLLSYSETHASLIGELELSKDQLEIYKKSYEDGQSPTFKDFLFKATEFRFKRGKK